MQKLDYHQSSTGFFFPYTEKRHREFLLHAETSNNGFGEGRPVQALTRLAEQQNNTHPLHNYTPNPALIALVAGILIDPDP